MEVYCIVYSSVMFNFVVGGFVVPFVGKTFYCTCSNNNINSPRTLANIYFRISCNPLFGAGFRMHEVLDNLNFGSGHHYPHNYLLESLSTGGIILTIPLIYCVFSAAINFHKKYEIDISVLPICLLSIQSFIYSMHNGHLVTSHFSG